MWYAQQTPGLGYDFVEELEEAYASIIEFPEAWPKTGAFRKYVLTRFPFNIIYKHADDVVLILAVAHHRRKPGFWLNR